MEINFKKNSKLTDISNKNLQPETFVKFNFKDFIRDIYDLFIRKNFYYFKYKNFFKKQNYFINLTLPSKGFSDQRRKKILNSIKKIKGKKILCIGCGNGFELLSWLKIWTKLYKGYRYF